MTPGQASASGIVLEISHPVGGKRICGHVFDISGGGVAFVDSGWTDPFCSSHVEHIVRGNFRRVGDIWEASLPEGNCVFEQRRDLSPEGDRSFAQKIFKEEYDLEVT